MTSRVMTFLRVVENGLLALLLTVLIVLAGGQVVLRNVFEVGVIWIDPLLRVMILWIGMIGAMVAARTRNHIAVDSLCRVIPEKYKPLVQLAADAFTGAVCLVLAYHGVRLAAFDRDAAMMAFGQVPVWICEAILPLGFGVIALRYIGAGLRAARDLWGKST